MFGSSPTAGRFGGGETMRRSTMLTMTALILIAIIAMAGVAIAATKSVGVKKAGTRWHFTTSNLTIKRGDTVKWSWSGKTAHNVSGPGFTSKTATKLTFSHTFPKKGTFKVVCLIHQSLGQRMNVIVR
jgi:plastocyanin